MANHLIPSIPIHEIMPFLMLFGLLGILALFAAIANANGSRITRKHILTDNEIEFFYRLQKALPDHHVFPQVCFAAILDASRGKGRLSNRGRFSQLIADYVICERNTMNIIAIVELDDRTHNARKDAKRDKMLTSVDYRVVRFNSKRKPYEAEIISKVLDTDEQNTHF